jgi:MFS family permease
MFTIDLSPLRGSPQYRRLYIAGLFSALGGQATYVATAYQLRQLTHSTLEVGALGLVELMPLLFFGLYGGVIADRWDRRRVIIASEVILMVATALLVVNSFIHHPSVLAIFVLDAFIVASGSVQTPSISAMNQLLVPHEKQRASAQLNVLRGTAMSILGPALGGLLAVLVGPGWAYVFNLVTFVFSISLLFTLAKVATTNDRRESQTALMREGVRYARTRPDVVGTYLVDLLAMTLAYPVVMLPFVAAHFHETYALSLLYCALPGGAFLATLTMSWTHRVHRLGKGLVFAAAGWGVGIAIFGYSSTLWLVFLGLAAAGAADAFSASFRQTMWNQSIPPEIRGRMGGLEMISYALGPMAGQFRAGAMAAWTTLRFSLTFGGLACSGSIGAVAVALPSLWRFDSRTDRHVLQVQALRASESDEATQTGEWP